MDTPVADFIDGYEKSGTVRAHMPGHKGRGSIFAPSDITEIAGADSLYDAGGIIRRSEENAASLFGAGRTFYSAGGSSQCLKAMCLLACMASGRGPGRPVIAAARNAHSSFISASMLAGFDIAWIPPEDDEFSVCRCTVTPEGLADFLRGFIDERGSAPAAVLITSPDYLGNIADIRGLAEASHSIDVPLIVDNAHGAYLKFMPEDMHPMTLGADACCDSAHKTLPVLTGGAYLHISERGPEIFESGAPAALSYFGSTSPSYLILRSLDEVNPYLENGIRDDLRAVSERVGEMKRTCEDAGIVFTGSEEIKVTADCPASGLGPGTDAASALRARGVECEFADRDYVVLMFSGSSTPEDIERAETALSDIAARGSGKSPAAARPAFRLPEVRYQPRETLYMTSEYAALEEAAGRAASGEDVSCPPAVPLAVRGEVIDENMIRVMRYYGIEKVSVLKEGGICR
ncbi:MAG: hypothetical protein VZQ84_02340 [Anaerovoracaceae bacterium]|nr:hypothetical protein [Anaerovoracaceae bacterium]